MANFSPAFLDELLSRVDLAEIIGRRVELKRSGANMMGLCPFHHEKSPSFSVSIDKQLYYCFGCGKGGGAFQFLMEHDGYAFPEAVEFLAEKVGMEVPQDMEVQPEDVAKRNQAFDVLGKAVNAFVSQLQSEHGAQARSYLQQRKLPPAIIKNYNLGFAPDGYGYMQHCFGGDNKISGQLEAAGLLFKGDRGYVDRFRNRLMFPIRDRRGKTVGFGGRTLGDDKAKYLNSPETAVFHKSELLYGQFEHRDEIRKRKMLMVVEGYMDVLALAAHDLPIAVAPLGTAIGERQITQLLRLHESPVFCFDGDRAGKQAAWRALERMLPILKSEHSPKFLYLPDGEDPDSMLNQEGREAFVQRIESESKPVLETWLLGLKNLAGAGADGRARMAKKADSMLTTMNDDYLRQAWQQEAETATKIRLKKTESQAFARPKRAINAGARSHLQPRRNPLHDNFMAALLHNVHRFATLNNDDMHFFGDGDPAFEVYSRAFRASRHDFTPDALMQDLKRTFSEDLNLSRWSAMPDVEEGDFQSMLLALRSQNRQRRKGNSLEEAIKLKQEQIALDKQRRGSNS